MRKVLISTAAVLVVAVIFFLLATLPAKPRAVAWTGDPALSSRTIAGAYHIHTTQSDGAGDRAAIAAAAARAELAFVILTDHGDGTRTPDPPAYVDGVLCIDAVEISTNGGHYVALGLGPAPYPLGGEPAGVVEDVARLGGVGFAAHPYSTRSGLAWTDWTAPVDGIEWLNGDSEWRDEERSRLARVLFDYVLRPGPALASILDRPVATLARWDTLTSRRPVVAIAGHDAHGGIGRGAEGGPRTFAAGVPSYEASFRAFSLRAVLSAPPSGGASADARALLDALRSGHVYTAVDALAGPAMLDFYASHGVGRSPMGSVVRQGPATLSARAAVPPGARMVLFRDGREITSADGGTLDLDEAVAKGVYRVEVHVPGAPGTPPVPWLLSNPIYFPPPPPWPPTPLPPVVPLSSTTTLLGADAWHVEKDPASSGTATVSKGRFGPSVAFQYQLRPGDRASQFVALVADLRGRRGSFRAIRFTGQATRPARVSVQLRYPDGGGARWGRSVYLDTQPQEIVVSVDSMVPQDRQTGPAPDPSSATALLFVVDLTNALPGTSNTIRIFADPGAQLN